MTEEKIHAPSPLLSERLIWLRDSYFVFVMLSVTVVYYLAVIGLTISFRPGVPSYSRMFEDDPDSLPLIYLFFLLLNSELRTSTLVEFHIRENSKTNLITFTANWIQTISLSMIPVASVDYMTNVHFSAAAIGVISTLVAESTRSFRGKNATVLKWMHRFILLIITLNALLFAAYILIWTDAEKTTNIALSEFMLFFLMSGVSVFNITDI